MAMHAPNLEPLSLCVCRSRRAEAAARQMPRREAEHSLRTRTATLCNELTASGQSCRRVAEQLHLAPRTLTHWRCRQQEPTCLRPRGRRCKDSSPAQRQAVLAMAAGFEALQEVVINFSSGGRRSLLQKVFQRQKEVEQATLELALAKMDDPRLVERIRTQMVRQMDRVFDQALASDATGTAGS